MLSVFRLFCAVTSTAAATICLCAADPATAAAAPAISGASAALPPELQAELDALQRGFHPSASLRTSLGWRDNVLLSPFEPIERCFARGELEAVLFRPMNNRWEFISFLNGDVLRYFSPPPETGGEQQWLLHAEARWQPFDRTRVSLKSAGYFRDMVIDLSETESRRIVAPTSVRGGHAVSTTRFSPGKWHIEPTVQFKRNDYRDYPGDYDEVRGGGRVEWKPGTVVSLSAALFDLRRDYDQRQEYSASGRVLAGTQLKFRQRDGELKARARWKAGGDWTTAATVGRLENRDRSSGYFDYDQKRARLEVEWRRSAWRLNLDAEAKRMDYLLQTVGAGIAPPPRISDDHEITLRAEREIDSRWTAFGEHRWERSRSNEMEFRYRANTVLAGVQRSF